MEGDELRHYFYDGLDAGEDFFKYAWPSEDIWKKFTLLPKECPHEAPSGAGWQPSPSGGLEAYVELRSVMMQDCMWNSAPPSAVGSYVELRSVMMQDCMWNSAPRCRLPRRHKQGLEHPPARAPLAATHATLTTATHTKVGTHTSATHTKVGTHTTATHTKVGTHTSATHTKVGTDTTATHAKVGTHTSANTAKIGTHTSATHAAKIGPHAKMGTYMYPSANSLSAATHAGASCSKVGAFALVPQNAPPGDGMPPSPLTTPSRILTQFGDADDLHRVSLAADIFEDVSWGVNQDLAWNAALTATTLPGANATVDWLPGRPPQTRPGPTLPKLTNPVRAVAAMIGSRAGRRKSLLTVSSLLSRPSDEDDELDVVTVERRPNRTLVPVTITVTEDLQGPGNKGFHVSVHRQQHNYNAPSPDSDPLDSRRGNQKPRENEDYAAVDLSFQRALPYLGKEVPPLFSLAPSAAQIGPEGSGGSRSDACFMPHPQRLKRAVDHGDSYPSDDDVIDKDEPDTDLDLPSSSRQQTARAGDDNSGRDRLSSSESLLGYESGEACAGGERRRNHNYMERKRRKDLRVRFLALRDLVPSLARSRRTPKVLILTRAAEYLGQLRSLQLAMETELGNLTSRHKHLRRRLRHLRKGEELHT